MGPSVTISKDKVVTIAALAQTQSGHHDLNNLNLNLVLDPPSHISRHDQRRDADGNISHRTYSLKPATAPPMIVGHNNESLIDNNSAVINGNINRVGGQSLGGPGVTHGGQGGQEQAQQQLLKGLCKDYSKDHPSICSNLSGNGSGRGGPARLLPQSNFPTFSELLASLRPPGRGSEPPNSSSKQRVPYRNSATIEKFAAKKKLGTKDCFSANPSKEPTVMRTLTKQGFSGTSRSSSSEKKASSLSSESKDKKVSSLSGSKTVVSETHLQSKKESKTSISHLNITTTNTTSQSLSLVSLSQCQSHDLSALSTLNYQPLPRPRNGTNSTSNIGTADSGDSGQFGERKCPEEVLMGLPPADSESSLKLVNVNDNNILSSDSNMSSSSDVFVESTKKKVRSASLDINIGVTNTGGGDNTTLRGAFETHLADKKSKIDAHQLEIIQAQAAARQMATVEKEKRLRELEVELNRRAKLLEDREKNNSNSETKVVSSNTNNSKASNFKANTVTIEGESVSEKREINPQKMDFSVWC